ncbi:MAG: RNA polymerase sigma factor [Bacteroidia bacterium]
MNKKLYKIVQGCLKNNHRSQEKLYSYFFNDMFNLCFKMLKNEDDALEVLNQGFLKVFTKLDRYKVGGPFSGWVYRVIYYTALDFIRARKQTNAEISEAIEYSYFDHQIDFALQLEDIKSVIEQLPKATKLVFELYAIEGYKHHEIAKKLEISEGTSKWHLSKAREYLKPILINDYKEFLSSYTPNNLKTA